jgi:homocysteine S-methyltransferase
VSNPIDALIERQGVVILDGGLATELERRGADLTGALWSAQVLLENPQLIEQVTFDYLAAGADVAVSASYQATFEGFARLGLSATDSADLMQLSVRIAREARDRFWSDEEVRGGRTSPLVTASIGCYGASLADGSEYRGDYGLTSRQLMDFHRPRLDVLAETEPDLFAFETIPCAVEAEALVRLLEDYPGVAAWLSFSCRDGDQVSHGEPIVDCVDLTNDSREITAVGINCTPPEHIADLLTAAAAATTKPLVAYPNSGEAWDADGRCWIAGTAKLDIPDAVQEWYALGARLLGGCCRTTPDTIRAVAARLEDRGGAP